MVFSSDLRKLQISRERDISEKMADITIAEGKYISGLYYMMHRHIIMLYLN